MAKQPPKIRLTNKDKTEYARLVKNAKAKARNVKKKYELDLSMYVDVPTLDEVSTRSEFNQLKERLSSFTNRANTNFQFKKNENGVTASKHEIYEAKILTEKAQRQAIKRIEFLQDKPFINRGKIVMSVKDRLAMHGKPFYGVEVPPDFNFEMFEKRDHVLSYIEATRKKADKKYHNWRTQIMKDNFITKLEGSFNDEADMIVDMLRMVPSDDFYEMYFFFDEFDFDLYDSEGNDDASFGNLRLIEKYLTQYFRTGLDELEDFKSFGNRV